MKKISFLAFTIFLFQFPVDVFADYPAIIRSWYDYGYSGKVTMMPTGNGRIVDWHARWPGHPGMYTVPSQCSYNGEQLTIQCSGCSGYFTCRADYFCYDGTTPINGICLGDVLPKTPNLGGPPDECK